MTTRRHPSRFSPTRAILRGVPSAEERRRAIREAELAERRLDRIHADASIQFGRI